MIGHGRMHGRSRLLAPFLLLGSLLMACPGTLAIGLVEWWNLVNPNPGGGGDPPVIPGSGTHHPSVGTVTGIEDAGTDAIPLDLARTNRATGANLPADQGWTVEPEFEGQVRDTYNGRGTASMPAGELSLAEPGKGVTLAVRLWPGGGAIQGGGAGPVAKPLQLLGLAGTWGANPTQESGLSVQCPDPTQAAGALQLRQWNGASAVETVIPAAVYPGGAAAPSLVIVTLQRYAYGPTGIRLVAYVDGAQTGQPLDVTATFIALSRATFGDMVESDGSITQAAVWKVALDPGLIANLGKTLDCLGTLPPIGGGGPGSGDPLLNEYGETAIHPEWVVPRRDLVGVLASDGAQGRHTRRVHECVPRVYELAHRIWPGYEIELIRQALNVTRGGAVPTRWRHPQDDPPGPVSTAPRWLIVNANEFRVERGRGGHTAAARLVLQEVV